MTRLQCGKIRLFCLLMIKTYEPNYLGCGSGMFLPFIHVSKQVRTTLWCQIRATWSLLGPVVEYPCIDFCEPCFSLFASCDFYSDDHVFHLKPPVVSIQTAFFSKCYIGMSYPCGFLSGPHFSGYVP